MARILVVDDSPTEIFSFKEILERHGHVVIQAASGEEGLELVHLRGLQAGH